MKKSEKILKNVIESKDIQKGLSKLNHFDNKEFIMNATRYIKAIKEGRIICSIDSVSKSGMSRTIKFLECKKGSKNQHHYYNFYALFIALGYSKVSDRSDYFRISGCGMDMIFHTNYSIIHQLHQLGFINRKECAKLAQMTPSII
jgi:hypothetical protein